MQERSLPTLNDEQVRGFRLIGVSKKRAEPSVDKLETARRLRAAMDHAGINQDRLAKAIGVANPTAHEWMTGAVTPRPHRLQKIAKLVGADVGWLLLQDDMDRTLSGKLLRLYEIVGRDRIDYLDSLSDEELRDLVDAHELTRARQTRRTKRDASAQQRP